MLHNARHNATVGASSIMLTTTKFLENDLLAVTVQREINFITCIVSTVSLLF